MRHFSTKSDPDGQELGANNSDSELNYTKNFYKLGPGDSSGFIQHVDITVSTELDIRLLRAEFESDIHPLLAFHCLMLPSNVDHDMIAFFHGTVHGISKLKVLYLSYAESERFEGIREEAPY